MSKRSPGSQNAARPLRRQLFHVQGMTCRSCELLIERKLKTVSGVVEVAASERRGTVEVLSDAALPSPSLPSLQRALGDGHYRLANGKHAADLADDADTPHWADIGGMLVLIFALYLVLKRFGIFTLGAGLEGATSLGAVFVVGLVAATSTCLAVVGGLLLSVSAKYAEAFHPETRWQKFLPLLQFNAGRLLGYFLLGGLVGLLGKALTPSPAFTGYLTIGIAVVMLVLGLNILKIVPKRYCTLPLPKGWTRRLHNLTESGNPLMPSMIGALTFFLPCGFTQSTQLLALASGGFLQGGLIMLTFALGTLPALIGISVASSLAEGRMWRRFLTFSGALVLMLGFWNLQSGLTLAGFDPGLLFSRTAPAADAQRYVSVNKNGQQIVTMYVANTGYRPEEVVIEPGKETWIYAIAENPVGGCASTLTAPSFNVSTPIRQGENWLGPIQNPQKDFVVACSMGMLSTWIRVRQS